MTIMNIKNKIFSIISISLLILITAVIAILGLPCLALPRQYTAKLINFWSKTMLLFFRSYDGLDWDVQGINNIPSGPFVVASKHQSVWDTIFFTAFFSDAAMVLKRIIILIPFYGLHAIKAKMIWLDRKGHSKSIKKLINQGEKCKKEKRPIVIFPEGTRNRVGKKTKYKPGVTALYKFLNIPCIPVALNSGVYWETKGLKRNKGKIIVKFIEPIKPGLSRDEFEKKLETVIETETKILIESAVN